MNAAYLCCLLALPLVAHADAPWGNADAAAGRALHDKSCPSCHVRLFGGDGSGIYTREERLLGSRRELLQRVATCNTQTRSGWFPEEEAEVAAWLNATYYHFEQ